ncbi:hypothetical protein [Mycobacterium intracellulare]|uniref:hypothetical protein n=1 Tax=Mycobacterium intracellulare TaxID=1767 RepID=UPI0004462924|nr:hypothetical protein [Mycobacterium intracellulare]ETZ38594.1 putative integrase catalytic region [Mycobacterium intracellulare MIN_052511_1280]
MGLTTGPVPARVHADVKAGLLDLIDHAVEAGWPARRACLSLGVDDLRAARWAERRAADRLEDLPPGGHPLHGLLPCERAAIVALHAEWGEVDRSHRKLAHRGSYLHRVWVSESTVRKVLAEEGLALQGNPLREPIPRTPWPDWLEWKPNRVWGYDFTHFTRAKRAAIAILDIVSRKWIATVVSAEETSSQVEVAFIEALQTEGLWEAADARATAALVAALDSGDRDTVEAAIGDGSDRCCSRSATTAHRCAATPPASSSPGRDRPAVRPPAHPPGSGVDRDPVRPREGRVAAPGTHPRSR